MKFTKHNICESDINEEISDEGDIEMNQVKQLKVNEINPLLKGIIDYWFFTSLHQNKTGGLRFIKHLILHSKCSLTVSF